MPHQFTIRPPVRRPQAPEQPQRPQPSVFRQVQIGVNHQPQRFTRANECTVGPTRQPDGYTRRRYQRRCRNSVHSPARHTLIIDAFPPICKTKQKRAHRAWRARPETCRPPLSHLSPPYPHSTMARWPQVAQARLLYATPAPCQAHSADDRQRLPTCSKCGQSP